MSDLAAEISRIYDKNKDLTMFHANQLILIDNIIENCISYGKNNNKSYDQIYRLCEHILSQFLDIYSYLGLDKLALLALKDLK